MACEFTINFTGEATTIVQNMRSKVEAQGGNFTGDQTAGTFDISLLGSTISGSYTIAAAQMDVIINHKPFLLSCKQIQSYLENNLQA